MSTVNPEEFQRFDAPPVINASGEIAFLAGPGWQEGAQFQGSTSVWSERNGRIELIADRGQQAAGLPLGTYLDSFFGLLLNDRGQIAFRSELAGPAVGGSDRQALWVATDGQLSWLARLGEPAPGTEKDTRFADFVHTAALSDAGEVAFFADIRSGPSAPLSSGLWLGRPGALRLVARSGSPVPGEEDVAFLPQMFESPFGDRPIVNAHGQTALQGFVDGPAITPETNAGIWMTTPSDALRAVVRNGQSAPGTDRELTFLSITSPPALNDSGQTAFLAFLGESHIGDEPMPQADSGLSPTNNMGLWSDRDGSLQLVVRVGDPIAGAPAGARLADIDFPLLNREGRLAFAGILAGDGVGSLDEKAIFSDGIGAKGDFRIVARSGEAAPGTEDGVFFANFAGPSISARGQTAFQAVLAGPGVGDAQGNALGLWVEDRHGQLRLVARTGEQIEVDDGDWRTIAFIGFAEGSGGDDGRPSGLSDSGDVAFRARFTDGTSGILVSRIAHVPEPDSLPLLLVSTGGLLWLNRWAGRSGLRSRPGLSVAKRVADSAAGSRRGHLVRGVDLCVGCHG